MTALMDILIWTAIVLWVVQAILSVSMNKRHAARTARPLRVPSTPIAPVTVIMPIKGVDRDLPGCIQGLCTQEYEYYRVILVVESQDDPAFTALKVELAKYPHRDSQIMIAGVADANEGQKVHNQLHVLRAILPTMRDEEVLAFADSDAIPGSDWLRNMAGRLNDTVAVSTGYRWLVPDSAHPFAFWSSIASVINSSVACHYRPSGLDVAWGGSMAMTVATAKEGDLIGKLTGALTDDYPITRMCREIGKIVRYLPHCLAPTPVDFTLRSLWIFARRQYIITRVYAPVAYWTALITLTLWVAGFAMAWGHLLAHLLRDPAGGAWLVSAGAIVVVMFCHHLRSTYRARTIEAAFDATIQQRLRTTLLIDRWLTPVWMFVHWLIVLTALPSGRFTWRGNRYHLKSRNDVTRLP